MSLDDPDKFRLFASQYFSRIGQDLKRSTLLGTAATESSEPIEPLTMEKVIEMYKTIAALAEPEFTHLWAGDFKAVNDAFSSEGHPVTWIAPIDEKDEPKRGRIGVIDVLIMPYFPKDQIWCMKEVYGEPIPAKDRNPLFAPLFNFQLPSWKVVKIIHLGMDHNDE